MNKNQNENKNQEKLKNSSKIIPTAMIKRLINFILDLIIANIIIFSLLPLINIIIGDLAYNNYSTLLSCSLLGLYFLFFETKYQKTPGKYITKTKVIMKNGTKPDWGDILKRTIIRFVPFEPLTFLTKKPVGGHDNWSDTRVVDDK